MKKSLYGQANAETGKKQKLPDVQWFEDNGTPIKKVNLCSERLGNIPEEDLDVIALSTQPIVQRRITLMAVLISVLSVFIVLELICLALYVYSEVVEWTVWSDWTLMVIFASFIGAAILLGVFLTPFCHSVLKTFRLIDGAKRLGTSSGYQRLIKVFCRLSYVWGVCVIAVQSLSQKHKSKKFECPLQAAMPENCGYEEWIKSYSKQKKTKRTLDKPQGISNAKCGKEELKTICAKVRAGEPWHADKARGRIDLLPDAKWFKDNGTPVKDINIHWEVLKSIPDDELNLIAISTSALVKSRIKLINAFLCILGIGAFVTLMGLPFMETNFSVALDLLIFGLLIFFGTLLTGAFLMLPCYCILEGYDYMTLRLFGISVHKVYRTISFIWGILLIILLSYMGGLKNGSVEMLPHVGMPENCGYDRVIELYSKAGNAAIADVLNALQQAANDKEHEKFEKSLDKILEEIKQDKLLDERDKERLNAEAEKKREEDGEKYEAAQSSLKEQYTQEIKPVYEEVRQSVNDNGGLVLSEAPSEFRRLNNDVVNYSREGAEITAARKYDKRVTTVNVLLTIAAFLCVLGGILALLLTYDNEIFYDKWYFVLIPFFGAAAFAAAGIGVHLKTDSREIFKITSVTAAVLFVCFLLIVPVTAAVGNAYGGSGDWGGHAPAEDYTRELYYSELQNYTVITGCEEGLTSVVIPSAINGKPVIGIERNAFKNYEGLTSVTIYSRLNYIGSYAFSGCQSLTRIELQGSVAVIETSAFDYCYNLRDITFNGAVAEWQAIIKPDDWDAGLREYTVYCTDGEIERKAETIVTII